MTLAAALLLAAKPHLLPLLKGAGATAGKTLASEAGKAAVAQARKRLENEKPDDVKNALQSLLDQTASIAADLHELAGHDALVSEFARALALAIYLDDLAKEYLYTEFYGIKQLNQPTPLSLDDVFVDLSVRDELPLASSKQDPAAQDAPPDLDWTTPGETLDREEARIANEDAARLKQQRSDQPSLGIDVVLRDSGSAVLLGGPGSGKSTLVKRLARACALGPEALRAAFKSLPWSLPVVVPAATYSEHLGTASLFDYVRAKLRHRGGPALEQAFVEHWAAGQCLLLLDGLDEVVLLSKRIATSRSVAALLSQGLAGNRLLVTSRPIGYGMCRVNAPVRHVLLQPFSPKDIRTFARHWTLALERVQKPNAPNGDAARRGADDLIAAIEANERVRTLAMNPLMLTIIALVGHAHRVLPERRVKLYDVVVTTLVESWSLSRSLASDVSPESLLEYWSEVAHWMHATKSRGTCHKQELQRHLVEILVRQDVDRPTAIDTAADHIRAISEQRGLMEERGANILAFSHQTFQEYLAARFLAIPVEDAKERLLALADDPRWHEVIRLTVGYIGTVIGDQKAAGNIVAALVERDGKAALGQTLCIGLRLAASCIADDVRVPPQVANRVLHTVALRLAKPCEEPLLISLTDTLIAMHRVVPDQTSLPALIDLRDASNWQTCMAVAACLSRIVGKSPEAKTVLEELCSNWDADVRANAVIALYEAKLIPLQKAAVPILHGLTNSASQLSRPATSEWLAVAMEGLKHDNIHVQLQAAQMLGAWGHQPATLQPLLDLLKEGNCDVRRQAAQTLGAWGHQPSALQPLLDLLKHGNCDVRLQAAKTLEAWERQPAALQSLLDLLKDDNAYVRLQAIQTLGAWEHQPAALQSLLDLLKHSNFAYVRLQAAQTLGAWGHRQPVALQPLLDLFKDDNAYVRLQAIQTLGAWGPQPAALQSLLDLLKDADVDVRRQASQTLGAWGHQPAALQPLLDLLKDDNTYVRLQAAQTLGAWGHQPAALQPLLDLLKHGNYDVRLQAAQMLGTWGHQPATLQPLLDLLKDDNAYVRRQAAQTLGAWGRQPAALQPLLDLLKHGNYDVRLQAAKTLGAWEHQPAALQPLLNLLKDADADVRRQAAQTLEAWGHQPAVIQSLLDLLKHDDVSVRLQAAQTLEAWGPTVAAASLAAALFPPAAANSIAKLLTNLSSSRESAVKPCLDGTAASELAECFAATDDDPTRTAMRSILFKWLWNATSTTD